MDEKRIGYEFAKLKEVYHDAKITGDRKFVLLPAVKLSERYNYPTTPVMISFGGGAGYIGDMPAVYVSNKLTIDGRKPIVFLEPLTPEAPDAKFKEAGWVRLCWKNPPPAENLRSFVASLLLYMKNLTADVGLPAQ